MEVSFFETVLSIDELRFGIEKYGVPKTDFCIIQFASETIVIAAKSSVLINRFSINPKFTAIALTKDDLYFRMADLPVKRSIGNPNLLPLI